jgi:soluble lytic murein transglycosylase-like protein
MLSAFIISLVLELAPIYNVPPYLVMAIITQESQGNRWAINENDNGTLDRGLMQLNSSWFSGDWSDPETNIRAGMEYLRFCYDNQPNPLPSWYQAVIAYNCGIRGLINGPPDTSIEYAINVFNYWNHYDPQRRVIWGEK